MKALTKQDRRRERLSMAQTDFKQDERIQWLRFVLNPETEMPRVQDWPALLTFAEKQAIKGICLPEDLPDNLPKDVLLQWIGEVQLIEQQNKLLNKRVAQLFGMLEKDGFQCCLLKGQGNAIMYPTPAKRSPGDIDVWLNSKAETVYQYVKKKFTDEKESHKHIHFPVFDDVPVDMHFTPLRIYHPVHNRRLQQWLEEKKEEQMAHRLRLADTEVDIAVPTHVFNSIYQLGHIMIHIEDEGIGLRQFVDYFYVLKALGAFSDDEKENIRRMWKSLGMWKLAKAVMWIEKEMLGLSDEYLLAAPNERTGRLLAKDILEGGNFGHSSEREKYRRYGIFVKKISNAWHMMRLSACFPGDAFFRLLTKMKNGCKMIVKSLTK